MAKLKNAYIKNIAWKCKLEMGSIMYKCFLVGTGGFAGAVLRYLIGLVPVKETMLFPVKTFLIKNGHAEIAVLYAVLSVVTGICAIFLIQYFTTR